jgi:hypothetical protein
MKFEDCPAVLTLLTNYLNKFVMAASFTVDSLAEKLFLQPGVDQRTDPQRFVYSFVVEEGNDYDCITSSNYL